MSDVAHFLLVTYRYIRYVRDVTSHMFHTLQTFVFLYYTGMIAFVGALMDSSGMCGTAVSMCLFGAAFYSGGTAAASLLPSLPVYPLSVLSHEPL